MNDLVQLARDNANPEPTTCYITETGVTFTEESEADLAEQIDWLIVNYLKSATPATSIHEVRQAIATLIKEFCK